MSTKLTTSEMVERAKEDFDAVYDAGYEKGKAEGGDIDYDVFWDTFQSKGAAKNYYYVFAYNRFSDETFKPKYTILGNSSANSLQNLFYNSDKLTEINVDIDARSTSHIGAIFYSCTNLKTVKKLLVDGTTTSGGGNAFYKCSALTSIEIGGTIVMDWNMDVCPLDKKSIESVVGALSSTITGKTCTLNKTAVNAVFTTEEWDALAATKPLWTFILYEPKES